VTTEVIGSSSTAGSGSGRATKDEIAGTPPLAREVERLFWIEIAKGLLPAEVALAVAASQPVGQRRFHNAGGMPHFTLERLSGQISRPDGVAVVGSRPPRFTDNGEPHRIASHRIASNRIVLGCVPRAPNRSLSASNWISLMMRACESATRPSIGRSTSRVPAHSNANRSSVFARDARYVRRVNAQGA